MGINDREWCETVTWPNGETQTYTPATSVTWSFAGRTGPWRVALTLAQLVTLQRVRGVPFPRTVEHLQAFTGLPPTALSPLRSAWAALPWRVWVWGVWTRLTGRTHG